MKTLPLVIITILIASSIIVSQSVFAQQTAKEILQERDDAKKTGLGYNGTVLIVTQEINKTEYKIGEKFSVIPHLVNAGSNVATITHGEPLFEIKVLDQNGNTSFIWPDAITTIGITESLEPGMSTTGRWVSGYGGFPEIVLDTPGNYTVYSMANINSEGMPAHMESIWSNPLEITMLAENQTTHNIPPEITVTTNLQNYSTGGKIIISGNIANPNNNTPLVIKILNPRSEMQFEKIFPPSLDQNYSWGVSTVDFWGFLDSGNYTVLSQYGQDYATTYFYLNSTLVQYLYLQSPLWQFKNGMPAQDVHCHADLNLVIRIKNSEPACVSQLTATKLVLRGWAMPPPPKEPYINNIGITGLQGYAVGQPINATVVYSGYYWYMEPDVKIFDSNGTQVWFNCPFCYTRTESIKAPSFGTFTYLVREYSTNALPIINKTGDYTMTASLDNKTAEANFTVTSLQNNIVPLSFTPCDNPYPQSNTGIPVIYMPANSTGKLCVKYSNPNEPFQAGFDILEAQNYDKKAETTVSSLPDTVPHGNSTVVYTINSGPKVGFFRMLISCPGMQLAIGYDNNSNFVRGDFPWLNQGFYCGIGHDFRITGMSGIGVKYITDN